MTKDASSSSPGSTVPNTKTDSRGRSGSGQDTCAISDTVPPLRAVTRRKLSFRLPAKAPAFPGWAKLRSCSGRPRSAMTDMHSARSWLVTVVASPGLAHFPARMTRQRRCDRDRRPVGPFPAVSPADSAGRGIRRGRCLLVHSPPLPQPRRGRTGRRPGWRPQPPDGPPAPRSAEATCPGNPGPREAPCALRSCPEPAGR